VILTNQSGIARGYYTVTEFRALHAWIDQELARVGARIDGLYFCPHLVDGAVAEYRIECACRKPKPGMLQAAVCAHRIDPAQSFMIGDKATDLEAASAAQVRGFLFRGGSLLSFVQAIVRQEQR
jgi:D-glycero-D-manno-heptose 1,7-bisphosphate phosphatase